MRQDLQTLLWRYDEARDGDFLRAQLGAQGKDTREAVIEACRTAAEEYPDEKARELVALGAAYVTLSRLGFDAEEEVGLPLIRFADPRSREMDADYAKEFRERAFLCGLSSLRPTDQKGWRDADALFAKTQLEAGVPFPRIAGAIQRNSPYAVISSDRAYGTKLARDVAAEREREKGRDRAAGAAR